MKKILAGFFSIFIFCQNCMASQLYFIQNPSKNDMLRIVETSFIKKKFTLTKRNPYYGTASNGNTAIVLLQDDSNGIYYYFDGDLKVNKEILKGLKDKNLSYTEINTRLKDSFDNIAAEQIFGKKQNYDFGEDKPVVYTNYDERTTAPVTQNNNYQAQQTYQQTQQTYQQNNTVYKGYIGQLAAGTQIPAYLQNDLNTQTAKKGDRMTLVLSQDLLYNGSVVAPQGSLVYGSVVQANSAGYAHRNGKISLDFNKLVLPSGKTYNISAERVDFKVESNEGGGGQVVAKVAAGVATGALVALMFAGLGGSSHIGRAVAIGAGAGAVTGLVAEGAQKGVDAQIPAYTEINLILTQPLSVTMN